MRSSAGCAFDQAGGLGVTLEDWQPQPAAQRRYCPLCGKAFAIVIPPDEPETERDRFCGVCAPLPEESGNEDSA
jgi:hypothetical protein